MILSFYFKSSLREFTWLFGLCRLVCNRWPGGRVAIYRTANRILLFIFQRLN